MNLDEVATKKDLLELEIRLEAKFDAKLDALEKRIDAKIDRAVEELSEIIRSFMTQVDARFKALEDFVGYKPQ